MRHLAWMTILLLGATLTPHVDAGTVFAVDASSQNILKLDTAGGEVMATLPTPALASGGADGLAASGSSLFFVNASGSNLIYEIDAGSGATLNAYPAPVGDGGGSGGTDGLAYLGGFLYSLDAPADTIFKIDPATGSEVGSCKTGQYAVGGLAGEDDRLFALVGLVSIIELDPDTCAVVGGPFVAPGGDFLFGLGFDGEMLYASGFTTRRIYSMNPETGVVVDSFDPGFVASGLAATREVAGGGNTSVVVDVRPGSCKNPLNTRTQGVVPVVIAGSGEFNVSDIDTETVHIFGVRPLRWAWGDEVTAGDCAATLPDGHLDAVLKFDNQALVGALHSRGESMTDGLEMMLQLEGATMSGDGFAGEDAVTIRNPDAGEPNERRRGRGETTGREAWPRGGGGR